jgi:hypothetical protein
MVLLVDGRCCAAIGFTVSDLAAEHAAKPPHGSHWFYRVTLRKPWRNAMNAQRRTGSRA